jgi:hypothetical protein
MRSLAIDNLKNENYQLFSSGFLVDQSRYISLKKVEGSNRVTLEMRLLLSILYNNDLQTDLRKYILKDKREKDSLYYTKDYEGFLKL